MSFYKTRSVVRDAEQWTGDNAEFLSAKFGLEVRFSVVEIPGQIHASIWVAANQEWLNLEVGEWIIRDSHGIYPCKNDVFHEKYEAL